MAPKTTIVIFILINKCGAPELSGKPVISNTTMVFKTVKFEWKNAFFFVVVFNFLDKATLVETC
jgi:hypothetical protein